MGKFNDSQRGRGGEVSVSPPTRDDLLASLAKIIMQHSVDDLPPLLQSPAVMAAGVLIDSIFEKPTNYESPSQVSKKFPGNDSGVMQVWVWPYRDRVMALTRKFLRAQVRLQNLVINSAAEGIYWRGDSFEDFKTIIAEAKKMESIGIESYKKNAIGGLRAQLGVKL